MSFHPPFSHFYWAGYWVSRVWAIDLLLAHPPTTGVHDLAGRLRYEKCKKAGKRPPATLLQIAPMARHVSTE